MEHWCHIVDSEGGQGKPSLSFFLSLPDMRALALVPSEVGMSYWDQVLGLRNDWGSWCGSLISFPQGVGGARVQRHVPGWEIGHWGYGWVWEIREPDPALSVVPSSPGIVKFPAPWDGTLDTGILKEAHSDSFPSYSHTIAAMPALKHLQCSSCCWFGNGTIQSATMFSDFGRLPKLL